jgi:spermidine/putrescine transport system permease protein
MKKPFSKIYLALIFSFLYIPILVLIVFSFNVSKSRANWTGFTLDWYIKLFHNQQIMTSLLNTVIIAAISSVLATILGTSAAIGIYRMRKIPKAVIMNITYIPVINPEIITGVSLMLLFRLFADGFGFQFGFVSLILAHITFNVPYVIYSVMPKLRQMNPYLLEAAQDLGCNEKQAFFKVAIPEIMPGIISGFLMALTFSIDDFVVSYFTSGTQVETLPITIAAMTRKKVSPEINALSAIIFIVVLTVLIVKNVIDNNNVKKLIKSNKNII